MSLVPESVVVFLGSVYVWVGLNPRPEEMTRGWDHWDGPVSVGWLGAWVCKRQPAGWVHGPCLVPGWAGCVDL